jgi:hypothetical protein
MPHFRAMKLLSVRGAGRRKECDYRKPCISSHADDAARVFDTHPPAYVSYCEELWFIAQS